MKRGQSFLLSLKLSFGESARRYGRKSGYASVCIEAASQPQLSQAVQAPFDSQLILAPLPIHCGKSPLIVPPRFLEG